jgi:hypothetical protein
VGTGSQHGKHASKPVTAESLVEQPDVQGWQEVRLDSDCSYEDAPGVNFCTMRPAMHSLIEMLQKSEHAGPGPSGLLSLCVPTDAAEVPQDQNLEAGPKGGSEQQCMTGSPCADPASSCLCT